MLCLLCNTTYGQDTIVHYLSHSKKKLVTKNESYYTRIAVRTDSVWKTLLYDYNKRLVAIETFSNQNFKEKVGKQEYFYSDGDLKEVKTFNTQGELEGKYVYFYGNGRIRKSGNFLNGKEEGLWNFYTYYGTRIGKLIYNKGNVVKYSLWDNFGNKMEVKKKDLIVERFPIFKRGGKKGFSKILCKKLETKFSGMVGRMIIKFTINEEGKPEKITTIPDNLPIEYKNELIRIISKMPKWKPGVWLNRNIRIIYSIPVKIAYED